MSKNPYVTEPRQNLSPKKPHFTLKTGENLTQNLRLKTLIFIVEKYGMKLLSNFLRQKYTIQQERFCLQCNYATTPLSRVVAYANSKQRAYITIGEGRYTISRILGRLTSTIYIVVASLQHFYIYASMIAFIKLLIDNK